MRRVIAYLAVSADGFIAGRKDDISWLDRQQPKGNYGIESFYRSVDTVIMGRRTYQVALALGQTHYEGKKNYVFTSRKYKKTANVEFIAEPVARFVSRLRKKQGKNIWLVGGAILIGAFLDCNEVDDLIIHVVPVLIGDGIPLTLSGPRSVPLTLASSRRYTDGVVRLHYRVKNSLKAKPEVKPKRRSRG